MRCRLSQRLVTALMLMASAGSVRAQLPDISVPAGLPVPRDVSVAEYRAHLDALRILVADCGRVITACAKDKVGSDDRVHPAPGSDYLERYGWLRDLLDDRNDTSHTLRNEQLPHAAQRLSEQEAELDQLVLAAPLLTQQRASRDRVLAAKEFQTVREFSLTERIAAWVSEKLSKLFGGAAALGRIAPWLGKALEWGALLLAATLLVLWVYRTLERQRTSLGRLDGDSARAAAEAESRAWADLAKQHAAAGEWRDAVHCMYWATIVLLENRRTLRPSSTRTPREALALIDAASHIKVPLRAQTRAFERIWYGYAAAHETDFNEAVEQHRQVQGSIRGATA